MNTLPQTTPATQPYVTLASRTNGRQTVYRPVIVDQRGERSAPISIKCPTTRNLLAKSMTYAQHKGYPFRLTTSDLADEAASVQAELAERYHIVVDVQMATMKVICAWCGKDLGTVEDSSGQGGVSHGMCADCAKKFREDAGLPPKPEKAAEDRDDWIGM